MTDTLWLVRHANREDFVDEGWRQGADRPHDPDLSPDGIEQARRTARALEGTDIGVVYASPFLRTTHMAALIADVLAVPVLLEWGFAEWMNARWFSERPETIAVEALAERFPRVEASYASRFAVSFPEEEPAAHARAGRTARTLAEAADTPFLLVGHGATVIGATEQLTGRPGRFDGYPLCGLTKLRRAEEGGWTAEYTARTAHLPSGDHAAGRLH